MIKRAKLCFMGNSHAAVHLAAAAQAKGFEMVVPGEADVVFVSEDTPTNADGVRDMVPIRELAMVAIASGRPVVITSQCEPGWTRSLGGGINLFHQADTLRIRDAAHRAMHPEMMIVGTFSPAAPLPAEYLEYLVSFSCPVLQMSYEEAEFAKVAINCFLAAQVALTNRLSRAAGRVDASWDRVREVLRHDSRIGPAAYLTPGRWQDSSHLLRDDLTLRRIMGEA